MHANSVRTTAVVEAKRHELMMEEGLFPSRRRRRGRLRPPGPHCTRPSQLEEGITRACMHAAGARPRSLVRTPRSSGSRPIDMIRSGGWLL
jgi:hypothetical protein